jgi:hypothetical protein
MTSRENVIIVAILNKQPDLTFSNVVSCFEMSAAAGADAADDRHRIIAMASFFSFP